MKRTLNARKDIYERALLIGTGPREDIVNALHIDIESNDDIVCNIANKNNKKEKIKIFSFLFSIFKFF